MLDSDRSGRCRIGPADGVRARAHGRGDRDLVDIPRPGARGRLVAHHEYQRNLRLRGLGEGGEGIGEARAVGRGGGRETATGAKVRVCCDDRPGFVANRDIAGRGGALESVDEIRVAIAHHPEHVIDGGGEGAGDVLRDGWH